MYTLTLYCVGLSVHQHINTALSHNGEFCVTVGPVTRTAADILTQSVIWRTWAVC